MPGGSVARHLAAAGLTVRAAVRNITFPNAQELARLPNIELVVVDLADVASLVQTYTGANAIFACTVPGPEEEQQGKNMADAAKEAGVALFIWSSLETVAKFTKGRINVANPLADAKDAVAAYLSQIGLPHTNLYLGSFMENFIKFPHESKYLEAEDTIEIQFSGMRTRDVCELVWIERDLAAAIQIIISHAADFVGQDIALADTKMTVEDMARVIQEVSGRKTRAFHDPTVNDHIPFFRELKKIWTSTEPGTFTMYHGWPSPHPLLEKHGYEPVPFEAFVRERLLPHLGL
ncbi:NAD(P)-binding protein [Auricularia subglabra TFB-10046 SS5]|nr:NAD(P)-binding protein [Auricularia subglabra TFB-10046 SS5]